MTDEAFDVSVVVVFIKPRGGVAEDAPARTMMLKIEMAAKADLIFMFFMLDFEWRIQ